jgi:hypothetical protein
MWSEHMPVKIGTFDRLSEEEFLALRQKKMRAKNPAMDSLLDAVATGQPLRVPLTGGQSARGLRVAISRAANGRGLSVETVEGDGFVAVRKVDEPRSRRSRPASSDGAPRRRGRPPKYREQETEIASLRDLASGES